jgi:hypothetical protein
MKVVPKDSRKAAPSTRTRRLYPTVTQKVKAEKLNMKRRLMKNMLMLKSIFILPKTQTLEKLIKLLLTTNLSLY